MRIMRHWCFLIWAIKYHFKATRFFKPKKTTGQKLNYKIVGRRPGDVIVVYADTKKANEILGWKTEKTMEDALESAWKWEKKVRSIKWFTYFSHS